uniref:Uncharacterized protein n=1 Tax=Mus spicilegus TaxID=10103 RepID=A0A8C6I0P4_MUSSI
MSCSSAPHSCSRLYISSNPMKTVSLGSLASEVRLTSRSASFTLSARACRWYGFWVSEFHTEITVASLSRYTVADTSWVSSSISANTLSMSAKLAKAQHFIPRDRILFWICFSPLSNMAKSGMVGPTSGSDLNLFGGWENSSEDGKYLWAIVLNWESKGSCWSPLCFIISHQTSKKKATSLEDVSTVMCSRKLCSSERPMVVGKAISS